MTYCLGILLPTGLIMASDSRSNAGVDQITTVEKMDVFETAGDRVIVILSAGNLATTQSVISNLRQCCGNGTSDLMSCSTMFDAAQIVGDMLRMVLAKDAAHVSPFGDPNATFLVGGQIAGEPHRLFQIFSAGNFIEAGPRNRFLQNGETKYGKPILDRALTEATTLKQAAKLTLLSFDATIRSNLSVAPPIDLLPYAADSLTSEGLRQFANSAPYWDQLRQEYSSRLIDLVKALPDPD